MAQTFATTPQAIYNVLANDPIITGLLGDYTFTNGSSFKSIAILTPGQKLPQLKSQVGLECIIHDTGDISRKDYVNDNSDFITTWKVYLIVWDEATGADLDQAAKRIMHLFYGSTSIETFSVSQGLGARVQTMIMIPENGGLHAEAVDILNSAP